jgi:hypothetical protein
VVQAAARRLGDGRAGSRARFDGHRRAVRLLVGAHDAQRLLEREDQLDGAYDDALERIPADLGPSCRQCSAFECATCSSRKCFSKSVTGMSSPEVEAIRPRAAAISS